MIIFLCCIPATGLAQKDSASDAAQDAEPLTYHEVLEGIKHPVFKSDIEICVSDWIHPEKIALKFTIQADGTVMLTSIEPDPPQDVTLCIAAAVSQLEFRATGKITPVKFAYTLPPQPFITDPEASAALKPKEDPSVFEPPTTVEKSPGYPGGIRGGLGIYASILAFNRGVNNVTLETGEQDITWYGQLSGGIAVFGEYMIAPYFSLGLDFSILFPRINQIKYKGEEKVGCANCLQSFLINVLVRTKFPVKILQQASLYPIILLGYSNYIDRVGSVSNYDYHGLGVGGGLGLENYTAFATPLFEIRYFMHAGWFKPSSGLRDHPQKNTEGKLINHNLILNLGIRFP